MRRSGSFLRVSTRTFTLGNGSALVNLESFEGTIHLRRPEELRDKLRLTRVRMVRELKQLRGEREKLREARARAREERSAKNHDEP